MYILYKIDQRNTHHYKQVWIWFNVSPELSNKLWLIIRGSTKAPKSDNLLMQFHSSGTKEEFDDGICETWVCHDPILFVCFFCFLLFGCNQTIVGS